MTLNAQTAVFASLYLPKWRISASLRKNMSQTKSNIRPRILLTINRKSTGSIDELRIVRGLYTRIAVARHPCFSWAFLVTAAALSAARHELVCCMHRSMHAVCSVVCKLIALARYHRHTVYSIPCTLIPASCLNPVINSCCYVFSSRCRPMPCIL